MEGAPVVVLPGVEAVWVTGVRMVGVGVVALVVVVMVTIVVVGTGLSYGSAAAVGGPFSVEVAPLLTIFVMVDAAVAVVTGFEFRVGAGPAWFIGVDLLQFVGLWCFLHV